MSVYQWNQLEPDDKQQLAALKPILILGPRTISTSRIITLTKQLAEKRPLIWGCLQESHIDGLNQSPQFKSLELEQLQAALDQVGADGDAKLHPIKILHYHQRHVKYILQELELSAVIGVYGSWHKAFHYTPIFYQLVQHDIPYKLVSSFNNQLKAEQYHQELEPQLADLKPEPDSSQKLTDKQLLAAANQAARLSFDYTYQTGAALAKNQRLLLTAHNRVVPYPAYMLHRGAAKEKQFAPPQDLNYFDTNHAEVELLLAALEQNLDITGTSLYINLLPCPICARMIARSPISRIVYHHDHSQGYGFELLQDAGKQVERV